MSVAKVHVVGIHPAGLAGSLEDRTVAVSGSEPDSARQLPVYADTNLRDGGGRRIADGKVRLIFWGSAWASNPALQQEVTEAIQTILASDYTLELGQYGINKPVYESAVNLADDPPAPTFSDDDIAQRVSDMLDHEQLPEPDEDYNLIPVFLMPSTTSYQPKPGQPNAFGAHGWAEWDNRQLGDWDTSNAHYAWVGYRSVDGITATFCHELAEICVDPEGDAWRVPTAPAGQDEIGDLCNNITAHSGGINYHYYWSVKDNACILPVPLDQHFPPPPPGPTATAPARETHISTWLGTWSGPNAEAVITAGSANGTLMVRLTTPGGASTTADNLFIIRGLTPGPAPSPGAGGGDHLALPGDATMEMLNQVTSGQITGNQIHYHRPGVMQIHGFSPGDDELLTWRPTL